MMTPNHVRIQSLLQRSFDESLTLQEEALLEEYVPAAYLDALRGVDERLRAELPAAFPMRTFSPVELQARRELVRSQLRRKNMQTKGAGFIRAMAVALVLIVMLVGGLWLSRQFNRSSATSPVTAQKTQTTPVDKTPAVPSSGIADTLTVVYSQGTGLYYWRPGMAATLLEELEVPVLTLWVSPNGEQVFYILDDGTDRGLYSFSISQSEKKMWLNSQDLDALTPGLVSQIDRLEWIPGSSRIVFNTRPRDWVEPQIPETRDLFVLDLEDGKVRAVAPVGQAGLDFSVSPDGQWLALLGADQVELIRPDGSERKVMLTFDPIRMPSPVEYSIKSEFYLSSRQVHPVVFWMPDVSGFWIPIPPADILVNQNQKENTRIYQVSLAGQVELLAELNMAAPWLASACQFSPDGKKLVYVKADPFDYFMYSLEDGTEEVVVTSSGKIYGEEAFYFLGWAPDSHGYLVQEDTQYVGDQLFEGDTVTQTVYFHFDQLPRRLSGFVIRLGAPLEWVDEEHFIGFIKDGTQIKAAVIQLNGGVVEIGTIGEPYLYDFAAPKIPLEQISAVQSSPELLLRQAVAFCINRPALLRAAYPWMEDVAPLEQDALLNRAHWAYPWSDISAPYDYDPSHGRALLEVAGWRLSDGLEYRTNGVGERLSLRLVTSAAALRRAWVPELVEQLKACGIEVLPEYLGTETLYAADGPLYQGDFDLTLLGQMDYAFYQRGGENLRYACASSPSQGGNFSGWCSQPANQALAQAAYSTDQATSLAAYQQLQNQVILDLPEIPLFSRWDASAARTDLRGFDPQPGELLTWNAAQWAIPGQDTITLGERSEPVSLVESAYVSEILRAMILGVDAAMVDDHPVPVLLDHLPSLDNGELQLQAVRVREGDQVLDAYGYAVELHSGVHFWKVDGSGLAVYADGEVDMFQATTRFEFIPGITWSDGVPVTKADYQAGYQAFCQPAGEYAYPLAGCEAIQSVDFESDTAYQVTWKPGYSDLVILPPFTRLPAHFVLPDGRTLAKAAQDLQTLSLTHMPGAGPYSLKSWSYGQEMVLRANPYYVSGAPLTGEIRVRFIPQMDTAQALLKGQVDVLGMDSLLPEQLPGLIAAQAEGKVRVFLTPAGIYEALVFKVKGSNH